MDICGCSWDIYSLGTIFRDSDIIDLPPISILKISLGDSRVNPQWGLSESFPLRIVLLRMRPSEAGDNGKHVRFSVKSLLFEPQLCP